MILEKSGDAKVSESLGVHLAVVQDIRRRLFLQAISGIVDFDIEV